MFAKAFSRSNKQQSSPPEDTATATSIGNVAEMLSASGRVGLSALRQIAKAHDTETFNAFVQLPVLAGSAIRAGMLVNQVGADTYSTTSTRVLELPDSAAGASLVSEALKQAIYPLLRGQDVTISDNTFSVGRGDDNDIVIPEFTISKKHAAIEINDGTYYLRDLYSTNGTMLNGILLDKKQMEIHDADVIGFARYEFIFLWPESFYKMLRAE
ncbi:MAG: FHA domain-containing protein [bacterium]|nr:FHA domain-containing protein [bacterium]